MAETLIKANAHLADSVVNNGKLKKITGNFLVNILYHSDQKSKILLKNISNTEPEPSRNNVWKERADTRTVALWHAAALLDEYQKRCEHVSKKYIYNSVTNNGLYG